MVTVSTGGHGVVNQNSAAIQGADLQLTLDTVLVGVLHVRQQLEIFEASCNGRVHDSEAEKRPCYHPQARA